MQNKPKIPKKLLARLQEHFDNLIPRNLFLVSQDTYPKKVYHIPGSTAVKDNISIAFKIFTLEEELVCDYFMNADGYTEHRRYFFDRNEVALLDNFEGQFGESAFEDEDIDYDEHRRIMKHNETLRKMLIKKGFIKK